MRLAGYALLGLVALLAVGCSQRDAETRAREAAEKIKASIPNVEERALEQKVNADEVKAAQEQLSKLNEYQGEVNGKLDSVTVNAIEAFQREHDIEANGLLTDETRQLLQKAGGDGSAS
jgi:peptidoglycan hydrolase-like protein with peptidoglycan-binding domain